MYTIEKNSEGGDGMLFMTVQSSFSTASSVSTLI